MAGSILAHLTVAGVIERAGRGRSVLRVTPRFRAHLERTTATRHVTGDAALEIALATWSDPTPGGAVTLLASILDDQDAMSVIGPAFRCIAA